MEREQIIKDLECCVKVGAYRDARYCSKCPLQNALALIKELTAKTEAQDIVIADLRQKLGKAEHDADRYANRIKELNAEVSVKKKLLIKSSDLVERIQADTVRKMQERLKEKMNDVARWSMHGDENEYFIIGKPFIDEIAKEMLEEIENE